MPLFFHTHYWYAVLIVLIDICDTESIRGGWFAVDQGICQGWVLAPLLFNIFFAAFISVAYTSFKADKDFMDALVRRRKRTGAGGGGGGASDGEPALATLL